MNVYYRNQKAALSRPGDEAGLYLNNIYDPMLELRTDFDDDYVAISGRYDNITAVGALCLGNTNAQWYKLTIYKRNICEGAIKGGIAGQITIHDFDDTAYIDSFTLELGFDDEDGEPLYLGYLYLGSNTVLPRFAVEPETGIGLRGEASRSFGGQVFGMKRVTLDSFSVMFTRVTSDEFRVIKEYVEAVQNVEPHIIDPYPQAREEFPPVYATLNTGSGLSWKKRNEDGFYYSGNLAWQEAR